MEAHVPPSQSAMAKSRSAPDVSVLPWLSATPRIVVVSPAVNSTAPSPLVICCCDVAPPSWQPLQPPDFCSDPAVAVASTTCVHATLSWKVASGVSRKPRLKPLCVPVPTICPCALMPLADVRTQPESAGISVLRSTSGPPRVVSYRNAWPEHSSSPYGP